MAPALVGRAQGIITRVTDRYQRLSIQVRATSSAPGILHVNAVASNPREDQATLPEPELHLVAGLGAVGRAVINELVGRGLPVRAIAREPAVGLPREVDVVAADITDPDAVRRAMTGTAVVYHLASAPYQRWPDLPAHARRAR